jgi:hypothetical protein
MKELLGKYIYYDSIYISYDRSYISFLCPSDPRNNSSFYVDAAYDLKTWIEKISNIENLYGQYITGIKLKEYDVNPSTTDVMWGYILETQLGFCEVDIRTHNSDKVKYSCTYLIDADVKKEDNIYEDINIYSLTPNNKLSSSIDLYLYKDKLNNICEMCGRK